MSPRLHSALLVAALLVTAVAAEASEQTYGVSGNDTFRIGTSTSTTTIAYSGVQRLRIDGNGPGRRFTADATYSRTGEGGKTSAHAHFVQELSTRGDFRDTADDDPDFLTILNQPFAVQLDAATMRGLRSMRGSIPFEAQSPFGGALLRGYLKPEQTGRIDGRNAIGVRFRAAGPMSGAMPQHPDASISGKITMDGTAYYAAATALLLALDATISITGNLVEHNDEVPVTIVYKRTIRAGDTMQGWSQALHSADELHFQRM